MSHEHESSAHFREVPWHGLGTIIQEQPESSIEMCRLAGCDWKVDERKLYTPGANNKLQLVPSHKLLVRDTDGEHLGVVKKGWTPLQNETFAEYFDPFIEAGMKWETFGSLRQGKLIFCLLSLDKFKIAGDTIRTYITGLNGHDGSTPFWLFPTNVRVVCKNTFDAALREGKAGVLKKAHGFMSKHTVGMKDRMDEFQRTMLFFNKEQERLQEEAEKLLKVRMSAERYKGLVDELLPFPQGDNVTDRMMRTVKEKRSKMWAAVKVEDLEDIRKTGWGAYQAVADYVGHTGRQSQRSREARFLNIVQGHDMLVNTRKIVLAYN